MKIVLIADTHGVHQIRIPDGNMLIVAGDFTNIGKANEVAQAAAWLGSLSHKYKVAIAGNHDFYFEREPRYARQLLEERGIVYLQDTGVSIEGLDIWGSPWQPAFCNWAFNVPRGKLSRYWNQIPRGIDILVTHGPPYGILDQAIPGRTEHVGCEKLIAPIQIVKPRVHVFGHLHGSYGTQSNDTRCFTMRHSATQQYRIVNSPWVIDLERGT